VKVRGEYGFVESLTLLSQRLNARGGEGEGKGGEYGFSSLMKQNKKGKNCAVFCFAGFFFLKFLCYEVFAKQKKKKCPDKYYWPAELRIFLAFVMLALHPCQQSASHLACTRPPDFVASRRSFTVLCASAPFFSTHAATPARRTLLAGRTRPRTPGHKHSAGRII
jgi:hypothetical protein